jgi:hypothetical protein
MRSGTLFLAYRTVCELLRLCLVHRWARAWEDNAHRCNEGGWYRLEFNV